MALGDPLKYRWLNDEESRLGVAGCVTVVPGNDLTRTAAAFGSDLQRPVTEPGVTGDFAAFSKGTEAVVVVEDNGFQGAREAVLVNASRASANGRSASIFWNVEGLVIFSCATKGKVVSSVELGFSDDEDVLPKPLRGLAARCEDEDADLVAIGAAMVEKYTGSTFSAADIQAVEWHHLLPPLDVIPVVTLESASLAFEARHSDNPNVASTLRGIATLDPNRQRQLAHWVVEIAYTQTAMAEDETRFDKAISELDGTSTPVIPRDLELHMQRVERAWSAGHTELALSDERWFPMKSLTWLGQVHLLGLALRYASHPDPATSAWEAVYNAARSMGVGAEDGWSRDAAAVFYPAVLAFIEDPSMEKAEFLGRFPQTRRSQRLAELDEEVSEFARQQQQWRADWGEPDENEGPIQPFNLPS